MYYVLYSTTVLSYPSCQGDLSGVRKTLLPFTAHQVAKSRRALKRLDLDPEGFTTVHMYTLKKVLQRLPRHVTTLTEQRYVRQGAAPGWQAASLPVHLGYRNSMCGKRHERRKPPRGRSAYEESGMGRGTIESVCGAVWDDGMDQH